MYVDSHTINICKLNDMLDFIARVRGLIRFTCRVSVIRLGLIISEKPHLGHKISLYMASHAMYKNYESRLKHLVGKFLIVYFSNIHIYRRTHDTHLE